MSRASAESNEDARLVESRLPSFLLVNRLIHLVRRAYRVKRDLDLRARQRERRAAAARRTPLHAVGDHLLHVGVVVRGKRLVAGAEVKDLAFAAPPGAAGAEDVAALEP